MCRRICSWAFVSGLLAHSAVDVVNGQQAGARFLPTQTTPYSITGTDENGVSRQVAQLAEWGTVVQFDRSVRDTTKNLDVGQIKFDFAKWRGQSVNQSGEFDGEAGGAYLAGGFFQDPTVRLKDRMSLHWAQLVTASTAGPNSWAIPTTQPNSTYPDATPRDRAGTPAPAYPNTALPTGLAQQPNPAPTLAYQDPPWRPVPPNSSSWIATLALVCIESTPTHQEDGMMFRKVNIVSALTWGFNISVPKDDFFEFGHVTGTAPSTWAAAPQDFITTMNSFYDGSGGGGPNGMPPPVMSDKYKFFNNDNCWQTVPEPSTLPLLVLGLVLSARRPRR